MDWWSPLVTMAQVTQILTPQLPRKRENVIKRREPTPLPQLMGVCTLQSSPCMLLIERQYLKFLGKGKYSRKASAVSADSGVDSNSNSESNNEGSKTDSEANEVEVDAKFQAELQSDEVEVLEGSDYIEIH